MSQKTTSTFQKREAVFVRDYVFDNGLHNPYPFGKGKWALWFKVTKEGKKFGKKFKVGINDNVYGFYLTKKEAKKRLKEMNAKSDNRWEKGKIISLNQLVLFKWLNKIDFTKDH